MTRRVTALLIPALALLVAAPATSQPTETASYRARFQSSWSAETHPQDAPEVPHFSGLIGGVHDASVVFWAPGELASPGIEDMAERGQITPLDLEVEAAIATGAATQVVSGGGIAVSPGSAQAFFTADVDHPLITLVSMIAPSPDWFVGVHGENLLRGGDWVREMVVPLFAYDAGTDDGATWTAPDRDASPAQPISRIEEGPAGNGVPFGSFVFTRLDAPDPEPLLLLGGRFALRTEWADFAGTRGGGHPVGLTDETGWFWFFSPGNLEMVVKVLDGCGSNGRYWVFVSGLTNVEVTLEVEDTETGQVNVYANPLGTDFAPIFDTGAFGGCP